MDVVQERDQNNVVTASYTRTGNIGGLLARTTSSGSVFYGYDGGGNVVTLTNRNDAVVGSYTYDACRLFNIMIAKRILLLPVLAFALHAVETPIKVYADQSVSEQTKTTEIEVGQDAPSIDMVDAYGKPRRLADLRGKSGLLLTFFPKCFTGNCTNQVVSLRNSYVDLQKLGVEVWAVSTDNADGDDGQRSFSERYQLPFALLPDTEREVCLSYGAVQSKAQMAARMSVFIDKDGKIAWIDKQINPSTHGADVLRRLQEAAKMANS